MTTRLGTNEATDDLQLDPDGEVQRRRRNLRPLQENGNDGPCPLGVVGFTPMNIPNTCGWRYRTHPTDEETEAR